MREERSPEAVPWARRAVLVALVAAVGLGVLLACQPVARGAEGELSPFGLRVLGQSEILAGSMASFRITTRDYLKDRPVRAARVSVDLVGPDKTRHELFSGRTNSLGTINASFEVPDVKPGDYELQVSARHRSGDGRVEREIVVKRSDQVLLTTDKPIYQPGQTIHIRALALRRADHAAAAKEAVTLEVADAKGNKVFKQELATNDFGIVAADFVLADEVNLGNYTVRAVIGDEKTEKTVNVKRYVLPKFKVKATTDKSYYLPGETVKGTVQADYFYGKPVSDSKVSVVLKTFDVEFTEIANVTGTTDDAGSFEFEAKLPDTFVGQPLEQGDAFLQIEAKVTDPTDHSEQAMLTSTVAKDPIRVNAIPESGELVPGVENVIYLLASYPDGTPARARLSVEARAGGEELPSPRPGRTDELGVASFTLTPEETEVVLNVSAEDEQGNRATASIPLSGEGAEGAILLRTDQALYRVGDTIEATALCSARGGTVYFDLVKDRQTVLTTATDLRRGRATAKIRVAPEHTGTLFLRAYRFNPKGNLTRDSKPVLVEPAGDLVIDVEADQETYRPGGETKLSFVVTDPNGRPVAAALGLSIVDESVFALQELQPGFEKVFFYLEQEIMKPRYEIHGFELDQIVIGPKVEPDVPIGKIEARRERAAEVAFASLELPEGDEWQEDTFAAALREAQVEWLKAMASDLEAINEALQKYTNKHGEALKKAAGLPELVKEGLLDEEALLDQWDRAYEVSYPDEQVHWAQLTCLGPDGKLGTIDDLADIPTHAARMLRRGGRFDMDMFGAVQEGAAGMGGGMARPMAAAGPVRFKAGALREEMDMATPDATAAPRDKKDGGGEPVRVREYFPETMYFNPALITDERGRADLTIPLADSITTWRMTMLANATNGQLGSGTFGLTVFQDFFVDIDLPVALTQNDEVSIPVGVFNWMREAQTVRLQLTREDWFELVGPDSHELSIPANSRDVRYFTLRAKRVGTHPLTVHARGSKLSDAIKRQIRIEPDGKEVVAAINDRLTQDVRHTINVPAGAIDEASTILVKIYPGIFSQVVEGLDSIFQMPFGCFEQTTSTAHPNVLAIDYMKRTDQVNPEVRMKAEGFINQGYQRMLTFEVAGGGFSWFGQAPANKVLTAYGCHAFADMSEVWEVDRAVISRTQEWLLSQQEADGSFKPDESYLHAESWGKIQNSSLLPTGYITWALAATGLEDERLDKAVRYIAAHLKEAKEAYTLAICANALVGADPEAEHTKQCLQALLNLATEKDGKMWWEGDVGTITHSRGNCATVETTALAGLALIHSGRHPAEATKVLAYLIATKNPGGIWPSTQGTVLALKCMVASLANATQKVDAEVEVVVNGEQAGAFVLNEKNADVLQLVDCKKWVRQGDNEVEIKFGGEGSTLYQIVSRHYLPWAGKKPRQDLLDIDVKYDKTELAKGDVVTAHVLILNNAPVATQMTIVDLGVPPGFSVESGDLAELVGDETIQKFSLTGRQIIVYLDRVPARKPIEFEYRLRAKFPIKAKTPKSRVYEYYNPDNQATAEPIKLEVAG